jgi:hypothetical protein
MRGYVVTTLAIEEHEAQRLFAQILRDELKLQPSQANALASTLCRRILASMPKRERSWVIGDWRAIQEHARRNPELVAQLRRYVPNADQELADDIWHVIYRFGRDLPVEVAAKLSEGERGR